MAAVLFPALLHVLSVSVASADELDYATADAELKAIRLDTSPEESFLSIRTDTQGRLFVGGREAIFRYDPDDKGGYQPRKELFRFPPHSWVYDIELRGTDLYALTLSALYVIPNGAVATEGLQAKRLIWGVPLGHVHQCFHALAWGPEGDLYISMGDPLWYYGDFNRPDHWGHWTFFSQPGGTRTPYTGVGGVFRCRPDGSRLTVVARGLRNSCGLAFDRNWNLFTNDNDHEGMPHAYVPGRMIHVVPHGYYSWPRGWLLSKTPDRADLLETMFDGMGRAVPVGQTYYDESLLPEKYRDNLLVARWGIRAVTRYPLRHRGASFATEEFRLLDGRDLARPVGVAVGRGGRIFVTVSYMAHNEGSPIYRSDLVMLTRADDPPEHPFAPYDLLAADGEKLFAQLSNASWWPRYRAHVELLRRGGQLLFDAARRLAITAAEDPALTHLIWLSAAGIRDAQSTDKTIERTRTLLVKLMDHEAAGVRLQVVRALTAYFSADAAVRPLFLKALADADAQVQHAGLLAFFKIDGDLPAGIVAGPARSDDTYLRQAATLLLAERGTLTQIGELCTAADVTTRLAGVLAAGFRLTLPAPTAPIPDKLPLQPWRTPESNVIQYAGETVDLRTLGRMGTFAVEEHWKAGAHSDEQEQLFALLLARLSDADEPVRVQAAHFLSVLNDPRSEPTVVQVRKDIEQRRLATAAISPVGKLWAVGPFPDGTAGLSQVHPPEAGAVDVAATYRVDGKPLEWREMKAERMFDFRREFGDVDGASVYAYCRIETPRRQQVMLLVGSDDGIKVWRNGEAVWTNDVSRAALPFQDVVFVDLEAGSNDLLIRVRNISGECALYLHYRALESVAVTLPEKLGIESLAERLKAAAANPGDTKLAAEFLTIDWAKAASAGDAERGRKLFGADGLGCAKCHAVRPDEAVQGGPSLAGAAKRFTTAHLVESILLPSKQLSPVFKATLLVMADGKQYTGLVLNETSEKIELLQPDTKRVTLPTKEVEERKLLEISPMPQGVVKTPAELRDLLAFLLGVES